MWRRVIFHEKADKNKSKKSVVQYIFNMALKKEIVLFAMYKKWPFSSDFTVQCEEGKVISAVCKYRAEVECNAFMCEAGTKNKKSSALKSVENFRNPAT